MSCKNKLPKQEKTTNCTTFPAAEFSCDLLTLLQDPKVQIDRSPAEISDVVAKYHTEAVRRIIQGLSESGRSPQKVVKDGYFWYLEAHQKIRNDPTYGWANWEMFQLFAHQIGFQYKIPLTAEDILDDPELDVHLLTRIDFDYAEADKRADAVITNRRNKNTFTELQKFLRSPLGKPHQIMSLRQLWGDIVRNQGQSRQGKDFWGGAPHNLETFQPFAGMGELLKAKSFQEALETDITVYRGVIEGCDPENFLTPLVSFTTSPEIAKMFAEGYYHSYNRPNTGKVISRTIKFKDILTYINPDGEYEVVVPRNKIKKAAVLI